MKLSSSFFIVVSAITCSTRSLANTNTPDAKKVQVKQEATTKTYKKKYLGTHFIASYDIPGADHTQDGKFYVVDNDLLVTGVEERGEESINSAWFKEGAESWREVPVETLQKYGFNKGDKISYFSFGGDKIKEYVLKEKVNLNMIQNFSFGETPVFYSSFYINLNDKGSESDRTKKASEVDSPTGLAYIGEKLKISSTKFIHSKTLEAKLDDPISLKALDAYNFDLSRRGHLISPKKVLFHEYGSFKLASFQDENGTELAVVGVLAEDKFVDLTSYFRGENGSLLQGVGEFVQDGLVIIFKQDGMHSCYVLAVIRKGSVMMYRPDCDLTGGC